MMEKTRAAPERKREKRIPAQRRQVAKVRIMMSQTKVKAMQTPAGIK